MKIDFFFFLNEYIWKIFLQKCLLSSPLHFIWRLSKSLNLIGCQGDKEGKLKKMFKNLLTNHKVDEAFTFHTCLWHYPVHELCFFFVSIRLEAWLLWQLFSLLWLYLANSQVSVYRTIGPQVLIISHFGFHGITVVLISSVF